MFSDIMMMMMMMISLSIMIMFSGPTRAHDSTSRCVAALRAGTCVVQTTASVPSTHATRCKYFGGALEVLNFDAMRTLRDSLLEPRIEEREREREIASHSLRGSLREIPRGSERLREVCFAGSRVEASTEHRRAPA